MLLGTAQMKTHKLLQTLNFRCPSVVFSRSFGILQTLLKTRVGNWKRFVFVTYSFMIHWRKLNFVLLQHIYGNAHVFCYQLTQDEQSLWRSQSLHWRERKWRAMLQLGTWIDWHHGRIAKLYPQNLHLASMFEGRKKSSGCGHFYPNFFMASKSYKCYVELKNKHFSAKIVTMISMQRSIPHFHPFLLSE